MKPNSLLSLVFFLFVASFSFSQNIIDAQRITGEITFDGNANEVAWDAIKPLDLKMQIPNLGDDPTEKGDMFLAYDDEYLYLGGRLHLSDSSYYRPTTYKRDAFDGTTDYFGMVIDSYNDKENGIAFFTTPTGLRWDGVVWNDAQAAPGEFPVSTDWNTFWDAMTVKTDYGWSVEMRIPWTSIRFQDDNGTVVMGMVFWWYIAAKNEVGMFPLIPMNWGDWSAWKPSKMQEFRFEGVYSKKPLYLTPYVLGGIQQTKDLNEEETEYTTDNDPTFEVGLDLKYSLTSNLTLDITANTDFAQVEADDQQVNLTRFSLFFPEKRQFFQERASIFDFNFEQFNRLFYSRKIGIDDDGNPVRILGGARMVGRVGKFDLGFLNMQTAKSDELNSENFGLLRLRRQLFGQNSYVGGIFTNRLGFDGNYNSTYGVDGIFKVVGDDYLNVKWVQSFEDSLDNEIASLDPSRIFVRWEKRRTTGFNYSATYSRAGKDYSPGMGFELRENFTSLAGRIAYGNLGKADSKLLSWQVWLEGSRVADNTTDTVATANAMLGLQAASKGGWGFYGTLNYNHEYIDEAFELSEADSPSGLAEIPVGEYDFLNIQGTLSTPFQYYFVVISTLQAGQFFDGNIFSIDFAPRLKVSNHLDLEGYYQFNRANFSDRNQMFTSHVARLKALYMMNIKFSVAAFIQFNSLGEAYTANIRLRYNPKEGNDLYIVYNDLMNSNRDRELPNLPFSSEKAIVLKYTYTFRL